jgi:hypothetical protein
LKLSWENTHVWQNLLLVSVDIGDFKQAIVAIEKLMDMDKNKPVDELPLEIISTEIINSNSNWQDAENLKKSLLGIFARANSRQSLSPKVFLGHGICNINGLSKMSVDASLCKFEKAKI